MTVIIARMAAVPDPSTRDRLLAAAVEVFVEQGYEGARLQDIARAAGLTTGAVYANFRGKSELLFAAIGARADLEMDALLTETETRDPRALLEVLGDRLDARVRLLTEIVERAKADGSLDPGLDADVFARFGLTLAMGALVLRALQLAPPAEGAWHDLISRLLDAVSEEQEQ